MSWTTRPARPGESHGVDYHFVTREEFEASGTRAGSSSGSRSTATSRARPAAVRRRRARAGHDVLLELDVQGALAVRDAAARRAARVRAGAAREEQRRRLEARGADDPEAIERRLARAEAEEQIARERFDAVIVNDDVDRAAAELAAIVEARRHGER